MTTKQTDVPVPFGCPQIPETADLAIRFCLWSLKESGVEFQNGETAAYWAMVGTIVQHVKTSDSRSI